jgi:hypothetical protein
MRRLTILALLAVTLTAPLLPVAPRRVVDAVAEVRPGMRGVARTVVAGTKVDRLTSRSSRSCPARDRPVI